MITYFKLKEEELVWLDGDVEDFIEIDFALVGPSFARVERVINYKGNIVIFL